MKEFIIGLLVLLFLQLLVIVVPVLNFWHLVSSVTFWGVIDLKNR